ncbi:MAG: S-adenosylmethionine--diacylglycerol 3-amino-3-carboxypropyl transferase [Flavobacteriales bacterium]|nr:S-adenosylmethionine--diacylglycerol 3-amino-3-carboxypropyl transferase [Flavobacteriales bacterium]|tara:strand:- start:16583 stop:17677 length:1095 start_codon:yes stop_codon:yes gene_type:complete
MSNHLQNVSSDYVRYANCWEDADILLKGLCLEEGSKILSIASAGDNTLSLLSSHPELIVAADLNVAQLNLMRLKIAAISVLNREEYLSFSGFTEGIKRYHTYLGIRSKLDPETKCFWDSKKEDIEYGIVFCGKFERYFKFFQKKILPYIHKEKIINELFENKIASEQLKFYSEQWNNFRWKLLFKLFFSKTIMGRFGRDPAFLKEVKIPVGKFIYEKAQHHLSSVSCQKNYFLSFILRGSFENGLPHYVRLENYDTIKSNLSQLVLEKNYVQDAGRKYGFFDSLNLSNIFEYMDKDTFMLVAEEVSKITKIESRIAYWNLMVPRKLNEMLPKHFVLDTDQSLTLGKLDKGFFYRDFNIVKKFSE